MADINEALGAQVKPLAADLKAGVDQISYYQTITFTRYLRVVLPLDGYVFWVKAALLSPSAIFNALLPGRIGLNQPAMVTDPAKTLTVKGSLHYATDTRQEQEETYGINRVVFTAQTAVQDLNEINPNELYIAEHDGLKFAFTSRNSFYQQAGLHHYVGDAVYPDMLPQIIDHPGGLNTRELVVSNSLPIWLSISNRQRPAWLPSNNPLYMQPLTLYPSFLAPNNIVPPYGVIHIPPETTKALGSTPHLSRNLTHTQLATETVRITIWGQRNSQAQDFVDFVNEFSLTTDQIGIMNMPILRDEKRTQSETNTIAMKKTIEYEISYFQTAVRDIARQLILEAIPTYYFPN